MDDDSYLIKLSGITYAYPSREPVFDGLDFRLGRQERIGLVGPNGSGKTTLLMLIEGLLKPQSGTVEVFKENRVTEKDFFPVREKVGFLFQDPDDQLFSPTVTEDVAFGPLNLGKGKHEALAIVRNTLQTLGLDGFEERVTYHLSFGEKKLVSLATVLAMEPEVLLLDEPVAGLDDKTRRRVAALLAQMSQPRIVISHNREFLREVTDKLLYLENSRLEVARFDSS
jgi:cobalt/nickel transport system ATP-binding protein